MYKDGWLACWRLDRIPWKIDPETLARFAPGKWNPDQDKCELYNLDEDFSQADNVADKYPDKVRELTALFWSEAEKYQVLPLLGEMAAVWGFPERFTRPDEIHLLQRNGKHFFRHDPADLQSFLQHQRRSRQSGPIRPWTATGNSGRHRGGV